MNDPEEDILLELQKLRPSEPRLQLSNRVARELKPLPAMPSGSFRPWPWLHWAVAPALGGLGLLVWLMANAPSHPLPTTATLSSSSNSITRAMSTVPSPAYQRVKMNNYLVDAEDVGVVYASSTLPLRKIRYQVLSDSEWRDPRDHSTVRVMVPREEVRLVPMNVY